MPVGDPWDARGLEWSISAPPPEWNFATIPHVSGRDAFYLRKRNNGAYRPANHYRDIELPKESACGVIIGLAAAWLSSSPAAGGEAGGTRLPASRAAQSAQAHAAHPVPRQLEQTRQNEGLAQWMA